jgi:hypothetical protein
MNIIAGWKVHRDTSTAYASVCWDVRSDTHNVTAIRASGALHKCTEQLANRYIDTSGGSLPVQCYAHNTLTIEEGLIWINAVDGESEHLRNRL